MMYIDSVTVEITDKCNARCPQCMRTNPSGCVPHGFVRNKDLTLTEFKTLVPVDFLKNINFISFNCPMGDPAAHNDIFCILDYIVKTNPNIQIEFPTNGSLRTKSFWSKLAKYSQLTVIYAIDGIDQKTHEIYRRNTNFDKIIDNATSFIDAGGIAHWQFIIFNHNSDQETAALKMSKQLGFSKFISFNSNRFNNKDTFEYSYNDQNYSLKKNSTDYKYRDQLKTHYGQNNEIKTIKCKSLTNQEIFIDLEGYIMPCCYHAGSLFAKKFIKNRKSFNNFIDVSFDNYNLEEFNIFKVGLTQALESYYKYMKDLDTQWKSLNPLMCQVVCGKK